MAIALMRAGKRVAVTSLSHKAINNMLRAVRTRPTGRASTFRGAKGRRRRSRRCVQGSVLHHLRRRRRRRRSVLRPRRRDGMGPDASSRRHACRGASVRRALRRRGGSALARRRPRRRDERSLAHPPRRPEPAATGLAGRAPGGIGPLRPATSPRRRHQIPPDRGLFLAETWRLRPELCDFTSDAYYAGRLRPAPITATRSLAAGNGRSGSPSLTSITASRRPRRPRPSRASSLRSSGRRSPMATACDAPLRSSTAPLASSAAGEAR